MCRLFILFFVFMGLLYFLKKINLNINYLKFNRKKVDKLSDIFFRSLL